MFQRCQVLTSTGRLCLYEGSKILRKKRLCQYHMALLVRGERIKWAPKRLLEWDLDNRLRLAVQAEYVASLNREAL